MEETLPPSEPMTHQPLADNFPIFTPEPPKKSSSGFLVILVFLLFGVTAFLANQNLTLKQKITQLKSSPSPAPALASPSPDITADWQTYTNPAQGYSLKYPSAWQINDSAATVDINNKLTLTENNYLITIYANIQGVSGGGQQFPSTPIKVSGLDLYKRDIGDNLYSNTGSWEISASDSSPTFEYQDKTYEINLVYPLADKGSDNYKANLATFDQILGTFQFAD
ncbi:MAG: hypothetical protein NTZ93_03685 [Candidatus Beckwithbacteria bacterium]|nr:hypothetical protein [Candidatus Beckwithbacteria bacterium]